MKFFFDNCLPPRVVAALRAMDPAHSFDHLKDKFPGSTPDVTWLSALADEGGWTIVTLDPMYKGPLEREALLRAKPVIFFLAKGWGHLALWEQASKLFHWWPKLLERASKARPGDSFHVPVKGGKLEQFTVK
ncbi:MAG: hypothetical protein HY719_04675 [Planctomycetes bacterium]|nr:hypothetical protein [Planctomycetota bacterium]